MSRLLIPALALASLAVPHAAAAQNVTEVDIAPPQLQIKVGQRSVVSATAYDAQGNILTGRRLRWSSANLDVARVEYDTLHSDVATVIGVGVGFVLIEARVGNTSGSATVQVQAPDIAPPVITQPVVVPPVIAPPVTPAAAPLPDTVFAPGAGESALRAAVRIDSYRFGVPAACGNGVVAGDGLILTSYGAIVGADSVVVTLPNGQRVSNGRVASYDVSNDLAVVKLTAPTPDSLAPGSDGTGGQVIWLVGDADCAASHTQRTRLAAREIGGVQLLDSLRGWTGAAFVNQKGELVGVVRPGGHGSLATQVADALRQARSALLTGSVVGVDQVARRENQSYGTVIVRSDATGAAARMTPLEKWQPASAGLSGSIPFTFSGPMGRYRAELLVDGATRASDIVTVVPGQTGLATLALPAPTVIAPTPTSPVAPPPSQPQPQPQQPAVQSGGGFPWGVVLLIAGGGGAAALLLGKKGGGGGGGGTPGGTGSILIHLPNP